MGTAGSDTFRMEYGRFFTNVRMLEMRGLYGPLRCALLWRYSWFRHSLGCQSSLFRNQDGEVTHLLYACSTLLSCRFSYFLLFQSLFGSAHLRSAVEVASILFSFNIQPFERQGHRRFLMCSSHGGM